MSVELRELDLADDAALTEWVELHNAAAGPSLSFAASAAIHWLRTMPSGICLLALADGVPVGAGACLHDDTVPSIRLGVMDLAVDPAHRGAGIGGALEERVQSWARTAGMDALQTWTCEEDAASVGFLTRRGFTAVSRDRPVALDVAAVADLPVAPPAGITLTTLALRPDLEAGAYAVACEVWPDIPGPEPMVPESLERWREIEIAHPGTSPDRVTLALDGEQVVGYGILVDGARPASQYHEVTGVLRAWRGRGVAGAIKRAQLAWARSAGMTTLLTDNDDVNAPMRAVNLRLGYAPLPVTVAMRLPLR